MKNNILPSPEPSGNSTPKIGVVIPTHNRKLLLRRILTQLRTQQAYGAWLEIIVVVDGSKDGTLEMLQKHFKIIHVIQGDGTWWYTRCMNEGFRRAYCLNCDYVLTLNDDCRIDTDYLCRLVSDIDRLPGPAILGSVALTQKQPHRITFSGSPRLIRWRYHFTLYHAFYSDSASIDLHGVHPTLVLTGRGMLIPMDVLLKCNYFDEAFRQYSSDYDFCLRAGKTGTNVYISWNAPVYEDLSTTGSGTAYAQEPLLQFIKSFFDPISKNYLANCIRNIRRHGFALLLPVTLTIVILALFKNWFRYYRKGLDAGY